MMTQEDFCMKLSAYTKGALVREGNDAEVIIREGNMIISPKVNGEPCVSKALNVAEKYADCVRKNLSDAEMEEELTGWANALAVAPPPELSEKDIMDSIKDEGNRCLRLFGERYFATLDEARRPETKSTLFGEAGIASRFAMGGEQRTVNMKHENLAELGTTYNEAFTAAQQKMRQDPINARSIGEVLAEMMGVPYEQSPFYSPEVMFYVVQQGKENESYGSAWILREDAEAFVKDLAAQAGVKEVFIIPSSCHETLILPVRMGMSLDADSVLNMVREVNQNEVSIRDQLFDGAVLYNTRTQLLTRYDTEKTWEPMSWQQAMNLDLEIDKPIER